MRPQVILKKYKDNLRVHFNAELMTTKEFVEMKNQVKNYSQSFDNYTKEWVIEENIEIAYQEIISYCNYCNCTYKTEKIYYDEDICECIPEESHKDIINRILQEEIKSKSDCYCNEMKENEKKKGESKMNIKKIFGNEIGKVTDKELKLSIYGVAIKKAEEEYVCYIPSKNNMMNVMDMTFDIDDMFFAMPAQKVELGDLIKYAGQYKYVTDIFNDGSIECLNPLNDELVKICPQDNILGFKFFIKIVSLFNIQQNPQDPMNNMLPFLLLSKESDNSNMMEMMLLSQMMGNGGNNQFNPAMLMLMDKGNDNSDMMKMLMMSQMMNGQGFNMFNMNTPVPSVEKDETK